MMNAELILKWLLRLTGVSMMAAWLVLPVPVAWMDYVHDKWLRMGPLPSAPVVEYMARILCGMYGMAGFLFMLLSADIVRYATVIRWFAVALAAVTVVTCGVIWGRGMPAWYIIGDAVSVVGLAVLILVILPRVVASGKA